MKNEKIFEGKKILITSGPVWVPIDKVRIITSIFGGALGVVMAEKAREMGADILLLMGPGRAKIEGGQNLKVIKFKYFDELFSLIKKIRCYNPFSCGSRLCPRKSFCGENKIWEKRFNNKNETYSEDSRLY